MQVGELLSWHWLYYPACGAIAGLLAGLLGIGGGLVYVPVLLVLFKMLGLPPAITVHMAIASSMAAIVLTQLSSVYAHARYLDKKRLLPLLGRLWPGLVIGAVIGPWLAYHLASNVLAIVFGVAVFLVALKVLLTPTTSKGQSTNSVFPWALPNKIASNTIMLLISTLSAVIGISGGAFVVPFLQHAKVPMSKAVGISALCALPLALIATIIYMVVGSNMTTPIAYTIGYIYWPAVLGLASTSIITAGYGAKLAHLISPTVLKFIFGGFMLFVSIKMVFY